MSSMMFILTMSPEEVIGTSNLLLKQYLGNRKKPITYIKFKLTVIGRI